MDPRHKRTRTISVQVASSAAILLVFWFWQNHDKPEPISEVYRGAAGPLPFIYDGYVYKIEPGGTISASDPNIVRSPIVRAQTQPLVKESSDSVIVFPDVVSVWNGKLTYAVQRNTGQLTGSLAGGGPQFRQYLGTFALREHPAARADPSVERKE